MCVSSCWCVNSRQWFIPLTPRQHSWEAQSTFHNKRNKGRKIGGKVSLLLQTSLRRQLKGNAGYWELDKIILITVNVFYMSWSYPFPLETSLFSIKKKHPSMNITRISLRWQVGDTNNNIKIHHNNLELFWKKARNRVLFVSGKKDIV